MSFIWHSAVTGARDRKGGMVKWTVNKLFTNKLTVRHTTPNVPFDKVKDTYIYDTIENIEQRKPVELRDYFCRIKCTN